MVQVVGFGRQDLSVARREDQGQIAETADVDAVADATQVRGHPLVVGPGTGGAFEAPPACGPGGRIGGHRQPQPAHELGRSTSASRRAARVEPLEAIRAD